MTLFVSPVYTVRSVPMCKVRANAYTPEAVGLPELELLERSIWEDGYTQPLVCTYVADDDAYEIVDGYHRFRVMEVSERIREREEGYLPIVVLDKGLPGRIASTIRHNGARDTHAAELMTTIVAELVTDGRTDQWIMDQIGIDPDELLRLKQVTGIEALFTEAESAGSDQDGSCPPESR